VGPDALATVPPASGRMRAAPEKVGKVKTTKAPDYFALLGVSEDVSQDELETRYRDLAEYLSSSAIPSRLQGWARQQAELVDEAYAILADRERGEAAGEEQETDTEAQPSAGTAGKRGRRQPERARNEQTRFEEEPQRDRDGRQSSASGVSASLGLFRSQPLLVGILIGVALVGAVLLGRYGFDGDGEESAVAADQQPEVGASIPLDTERVAELMAAVEQNPGDAFALFELGESFFQANQWDAAITWFTKLLELDPNNVHAMTDIGTSHFELGRMDEAETTWLAALELAPGDAQVHYNLGFLYANAEPPEFAAAKQAWERVVQLEPDSDIAQTAQVHLDSLDETLGPGETAQVTQQPSTSEAQKTPTPSEMGRRR
jgi:tetratricopeptide (TPR) repeat protein